MYNTAKKFNRRQLDLSKLKNRRRKILSSAETLKGITPFDVGEGVTCVKKEIKLLEMTYV